ncbi:MAG: beta-mannosidase [Muribaculaceae bacterium]|nr:beta-mannosidase [Muribaculaceae bacterium]
MKIRNIYTAAMLAALCALSPALTACGDDEPEPTPPAGELVPGPGDNTGDDNNDPQPDPEPTPTAYAPLSNPEASTSARKVYDFICDQSGQRIISGAMANVNNNNDFADWVFRVSGKYPALCGYDFIHLADSRPGSWIDYSDISAATTQWNANGLVSYMWHWNAPDSEEAWRNGDSSRYGFYIPGRGASPTSFDIREALKEGTWQHDFIIEDIDRVAGYLKLLQQAGIPVIWRPLHEAAGNYAYADGAWFWWGRYGDQYTRQLWDLMYDRLTSYHHLDNLIWVWTAQYQEGYADRMAESYPGNEKVDIIGVDIYANSDDAQADAYQAALNLGSRQRPVALSECGRVPSPDKCIDNGADWSWFMIWYTYDIKNGNASSDSFGNTASSLRSIMHSDRVITREEMPAMRD